MKTRVVRLISSTLLLATALAAAPLAAHAQLTPAADAPFVTRFTCTPSSGLTPVDASIGTDLILDLTKAATDISSSSLTRDFDFPGRPIRVSLLLRAFPDRVELSDTFMQKTGKSWQLMMLFGAPSTFNLPIPEGTIYAIQGGGGDSDLPPYEIDCQLTRTKAEPNCATCR